MVGFLNSLEEDLKCSLEGPYETVGDHSILSCGCVVSEKSRDKVLVGGTCKICGDESTYIGPINPLRKLYKKITERAEPLTDDDLVW